MLSKSHTSSFQLRSFPLDIYFFSLISFRATYASEDCFVDAEGKI